MKKTDDDWETDAAGSAEVVKESEQEVEDESGEE